jgi:[ribosomal protein S5]-alanine N-acetyltransferase
MFAEARRMIAVMTDVALIEIDRTLAQAIAMGHPAFEAHYDAGLGENLDLVREIVRQTLTLLAAVPRDPPWVGYLAIDELDRLVVGTCAVKTGPSDDGCVEIAYLTFPSFQGQGFATAMAQKLITMALASPGVRSVIAHTLPQRNASTRVLEKVGMHCVGDVDNPEDGRVWQWRCGAEV